MRKITVRSFRRRPAVRFTLADRLVAAGQRLRTDEVATRATVNLRIAAQWMQAKGGAR